MITKRNIIIFSLLSVISALTLVSCKEGKTSSSKEGVSILRYEETLFATPADQLGTALNDFSMQFQSPLLPPVYPNDPQYMADLQGFLNDSVVHDIYVRTHQRYADLSWLEKELGVALAKAHKLDEDIEVQHIATWVTAWFMYPERIVADRESKSVLISLDQYALGEMEDYAYFNLPMYIVELSDSAYLASDVMTAIAHQYIAAPDENGFTMLDLMIAEGKALYFLDQVMPDKADYLKLRYTPEQMEWMKKNESNVWGYFIQHNLLYDQDFNHFHNFVDEAPKTNAFSDSAPRTTDYIGWQIVKSYMKNNKVSLKELFENKDSQGILLASEYKP
ncbi:MAG: hypothetical protein K5864_05710 [Bacteroidales bacterium]|nr:hypothetical protein [Bacteroidales bacterium]